MEEVIQGIYKIENKNNHKVYIGQSKDIYKRWQQHKAMLEKGTHHSPKLQHSYNHSKDKTIFEYSILELIGDESKLTEREQYYIDKYDSLYHGYNCTTADNSVNYKKASNPKKYYYNLFEHLYIDGTVYYGSDWLSRMQNKKAKHYSALTMRRMCIILKWFYNNYNIEEGYTMRVSVFNKKYNVRICKNDKVVGYYFFGTDVPKGFYRPVHDLTGYYNNAPMYELEIELSYEDCLQRWNPIDQLEHSKY